VAAVHDALGQRHGLSRRLLLGALGCALGIAASAVERARLEANAVGVQQASHALAEALGLGALARVLAGRTLAAQIGGAKQDHGAFRGNALSHFGSQGRVGLLHAGQEACLITARAIQGTGLGPRAVGVGKARFHFARAFVHAASADIVACGFATIDGWGGRRKQIGRAFAVNALEQRGCEWRSSVSDALQRAFLVAAWALEGTVLLLCTISITHAGINLRLAVGQRATARLGAISSAAINVNGLDCQERSCAESDELRHHACCL